MILTSWFLIVTIFSTSYIRKVVSLMNGIINIRKKKSKMSLQSITDFERCVTCTELRTPWLKGSLNNLLMRDGDLITTTMPC